MVVALAAASLMSATGPAVAAQPQSIVQIVAHQDDDLLFMNPDIATGINNGYETTTVFVTAGENAPGRTPDQEAYAAQRQAGARQSYSAMARVTGCELSSTGPGGCWTASSPVFSNHVVQLFTLIGAPHVRLVCLNLPENADTRFLGGDALSKLRDNASLVTDTLHMENAPPQRYDQGDVVDVLAAVLETYSATLVRAQDPAPDLRLRGDHQDHVAAAWFADKAVDRYSAAHPRVLLDHYRDYDISELPANLMPAHRDEKTRIVVDHYLPHDPLASQDADFVAWEQRQYSRHPRGTQWMRMDSTGRLRAFAVAGGKLYEWFQNATFQWQGPVSHGDPGGPLAVGLTVGNNQDGRLEVFGQRADTGEIISRFQTGGTWGWGSLGNPSGGVGALNTSSPVVASNGDGRLQVFVSNAGGGVSSRWQVQVNGGWNDTWADMGGTFVQGPPAAGVTNDGRIELFAPTKSGIQHWYQPSANAAFQVDTNFPQVPPGSGLTVGKDQSGRIEVFYRQAGTANVMTIYQIAVNGAFNPTPANTGGHGGVGEIAAVTPGNGRILVATRNGGGGVSTSSQVAPDGGFGGWADQRGSIVGTPAAVRDRDDLVVLAVLGYDGRLYVNSQNDDGAFRGWELVG